MNTVLAEAIEGVETVKGVSQEEFEIARFQGAVTWMEKRIHQTG